MRTVELTMETVSVTSVVEQHPHQNVRQTIIDVLRQQEGLKRKLHELLDQLGTNKRVGA
jgi:hypothetical protein